MPRIISLLVFAVLLLGGAGCFGSSQPQMTPITLEYWRYGDTAEDLAPVIAAYQETHPQVTVNVTVIPEEKYQKELLTALAEDRGPDIMSLPSYWVKGWLGKLAPMPKEMNVIERQKNQKGQVVTVALKKPAISLLQLERQFVEVVPDSVVHRMPGDKPGDPPQSRIVGLPYSVDTLAMYYNRDLLKNAGLSEPAKTWSQLLQQSQTMTRLDDEGELEQSGAAIGSSNLRNHAELLAALMIQNGSPLITMGGKGFIAVPPGYDGLVTPGYEAATFFRSFGIKGSSSYAWNPDFQDDLDTFTAGRTAYFFGFPGDAKTIRDQAPRLDLGVAPLPQVDIAKQINLALFAVETVSAKSRVKEYAWDFLVFATQTNNVGDFLESTDRPTAHRSLISGQLEDPEIGPFAGQVLTAEVWYNGYDYPKARDAFAYLADKEEDIETSPLEIILTEAGNMVDATYSPPR